MTQRKFFQRATSIHFRPLFVVIIWVFYKRNKESDWRSDHTGFTYPIRNTVQARLCSISSRFRHLIWSRISAIHQNTLMANVVLQGSKNTGIKETLIHTIPTCAHNKSHNTRQLIFNVPFSVHCCERCWLQYLFQDRYLETGDSVYCYALGYPRGRTSVCVSIVLYACVTCHIYVFMFCATLGSIWFAACLCCVQDTRTTREACREEPPTMGQR